MPQTYFTEILQKQILFCLFFFSSSVWIVHLLISFLCFVFLQLTILVDNFFRNFCISSTNTLLLQLLCPQNVFLLMILVSKIYFSTLHCVIFFLSYLLLSVVYHLPSFFHFLAHFMTHPPLNLF